MKPVKLPLQAKPVKDPSKKAPVAPYAPVKKGLPTKK